MEQVDLVIDGGLVITMDPERRMLRDGAVAVRGARIVTVGKARDIANAFRADRTIDARGKLVLPGLIDGHNHPVHYLSRGISDDQPTHQRWATRVYPFELAASEEDTYVGALGNFAAMLKTGTTCFNDPGGYHVDAVARACLDSGIRGIITRSSQDLSSDILPLSREAQEATAKTLAEAVELFDRWHGAADGRLRVWFALRSVYNTSDQLCREVKRLADDRKVGIHCHLCVTESENVLSLKQWGARSLERFRDLGLLGPNLYLVHMGAVNEQEVSWLAAADVKVAHCPSASMLGGFGCIAHGKFPLMVEKGVTVSLGTDAGAVSRFLDLVRIMYLAANAHKDAEADPTVIGCYKALEMATIDGARALGWDDEIGSLEPGKRADLIVVDADGVDWHPNPLSNPVANFVYTASGASVRTVVVDGKILVEDRRFTAIEEADLWRRCDETATAVLGRANIDLTPGWPLQ
ncbi:MAG: amidohydrolase [Chloroflexi bacterium]|nr:amidohydrolase [Chloroflexota bacterium]